MKPGHMQAVCPQPKACLACGKLDHAKAACPKLNETCRNCGQVGHLQSRCLSAKAPSTTATENQVTPGSTPGQHCFVCGSLSHLKTACPHTGKVCDICKKVGHLKATCRSAQLPPAARAAMVSVVGRPVLPASSQQNPAAAGSKACYVCGSVAHERKNCPHKAQVCEACGKTGHFTALCQMKKN